MNKTHRGPAKKRQKKTSPLGIAVQERDRDVLNLVRQAVDEHRMMLAYQPIMQTNRPEKPAFYEGLIRLMDRTGRIIPAKDFIDRIEKDELGRKVDCLALKAGLEALSQYPALRLSINLSAHSIGYRPWIQVLNRGLRADPSIGSRLILEITERSAMEMPDVVQAFMADQQKRGISFALDDFGVGYTSFRYLREFYFDILKIDGQFIRGIHENPDNQVLTNALVSIAQHFDMFTVAESVENTQDAAYLSDVGIDCMQGYFFGAPTIRPLWMRQGEQKQAS